MQLSLSHKILVVLAAVIALVLVVAAVNFLIIRYRGTPVPAPDIPRSLETYGQEGEVLRYAVLGDSTTISQGGDYNEGYARETARFLAGNGFRVSLQNFGQSGATAADVASNQAPKASEFNPDIALIAVGANDVTHLTSLSSIRESLKETIGTLKRANPDVRIILTGSPQMGAVPRFPQPSSYLAGVRTGQVNEVVRDIVANEESVYFAPIAAETGPRFAATPDKLFARDLFHPNTQGYNLWTNVLKNSLGSVLD